MVKTLNSIDITPVLACYNTLVDNIVWTQYNIDGSKQCGLQYRADEDQWASAVGSRPNVDETEFSLTNDLFKNTIFEELMLEYNLYRTRLMWVGSYKCYSMHSDLTARIHIPLITNLNAYFVFKDTGLHHLETGYVYWTDTRKPHTFMNCSRDTRLHLVGAVVDK